MRSSALVLSSACLLVLLSGCGGDRINEVTDTQAALKDPKFATGEKVRLVDRIANEAPPEKRRDVLKDVAWKTSNGPLARFRAIQLLADDPSDPDAKDTRRMLTLMIGSEADPALVVSVSQLASERGWTDLTPALVRQLAKPRMATDDNKRAEWIALVKLHPDQSVEAVAFEVFVQPAQSGLASDRVEREREAAWQLLARLDKDGSKRRSFLATMAENPSPAMVDIRATATDLGAVPLTASELSWLRQLRKPENAAWWQKAKDAIAKLSPEAREGLTIRDAEPIRWAAAHEPSWLSMSREDLVAQIQANLKGREMFIRSESGGDAGQGTERFADNVKKMKWADLLSLLVIDRAVHTQGMAERLWAQALQDQKDTTTEYGGFISTTPDGSSFIANLYPPRASARFSDNRFVASDELLTAGATGLLVYHFHAQKSSNADYAGPSGGDVDYAHDSGRLCVVFTPVKPGVFDVDAYFGDRIRCDLGTIGEPLPH